MLSPTSRYASIETATLETDNGQPVVYLLRRFLPQPDQFALLQEHLVSEHDRLDIVTAMYLGDPEQFWRVADANGAMHPGDLTAVAGRRLRITLPAGFTGNDDA